jgi:hypothetical protein
MACAVNDPVDLSIRHFVDAWRTMCVGADGFAEEAVGGVHYVFSGIPIPFFNVALLTDRDVAAAPLSAFGHQARDWASKHDVPWLFVITHEALVAGTKHPKLVREAWRRVPPSRPRSL